MIIYVDDGIVFGENREQCEQVTEALSAEFKTRIMSGEIFVGIEIKQLPDGLDLSQRRYIRRGGYHSDVQHGRCEELQHAVY